MTTSIDTVLDRLAEATALRSDDAGVRIRSSYQPAAGPGTKVFPPTYPDVTPPYMLEDRFDGSGSLRSTVLIDSVQSQANRCELALLDACDDGELDLPFLDLRGEVEGVPVRVTSLEAPHRGPDAYFRDSQAPDGVSFDDTEVGRALRAATARSARAFFTWVPSDLIFGFWDSQRGGRGIRLARAYTSEMVGLDPKIGQRGAVRVDPNNIERVDIAFPDKHPEQFVVLTDGKVPKGMKPHKPSDAGHGNVPSISANAGVSVTAVERHAFLSAAALARLRFPDGEGQVGSTEADVAARTVLAATALLADRLAFDHASVFLRSGCDLLTESSSLAWVGRGGRDEDFELDTRGARELLLAARARAAALGLEWASVPVALEPKANLAALLAQTFATPVTED